MNYLAIVFYNPLIVNMVNINFNVVNTAKDFMGFIDSIDENGLFFAVFKKSIPEAITDSLQIFFREAGIFVLANGDLLFLLPAIVFMFMTFFIGKNRFTRFILPLWFLYFISRLLLMMIF